MAETIYKTAKDICKGDYVLTEEGEALRVLSAGRGLIEGCVMIEHERGWAEVGRNDKVAIARLHLPQDKEPNDELADRRAP